MELSCAYFLQNVRDVTTHGLQGVVQLSMDAGTLTLHSVPQPIVSAFLKHYGDPNGQPSASGLALSRRRVLRRFPSSRMEGSPSPESRAQAAAA